MRTCPASTLRRTLGPITGGLAALAVTAAPAAATSFPACAADQPRQIYAGQINSASATRRRVRLNVFTYKGHPRGATAHFVLDFTTKGDLAESMQLRGDLYLAKDKGEWKIFGYDVDQAEPA